MKHHAAFLLGLAATAFWLSDLTAYQLVGGLFALSTVAGCWRATFTKKPAVLRRKKNG